MSELANDFTDRLILDGTKIGWYKERIDAWERGERIAPITIDMALTRACNYACGFCYATMQENDRQTITSETMTRFLDDCAELGVKGVSLVSDGESTLHPAFEHTITYGHSKGIAMAVGSNGFLLDEGRIRTILPALTYFRFNITAGEPERYRQIMGSKPGAFEKVCENIKMMARIKKETGSKCTIGMQAVMDPRYSDQIIPLAKLGQELGADYLVLKHISDNELGTLGVDYSAYEKIEPLLKEAEGYSTEAYQVSVKWQKIKAGSKRSYQQCHGARFLLQISGSGLISPCGMLFGNEYKKMHIGNIVTDSFREIVLGERYSEVMDYLGSKNFNAQTACGQLCLQHLTNVALDNHKKGIAPIEKPIGKEPEHVQFI